MNEIAGKPETEERDLLVFGAEAFTSEEYARAEPDRLWRKVWQHACREEDIPEVGDYVAYDICDDTILVVRSASDEISAFYNVCAHRGRRLADGCGHVQEFRCSYHAWKYNLKGECTRVLDREDWGDRLEQDRLDLPHVRVDTWGGWVWINMDPDAAPLREYLEPASSMLEPYELDRMRYRWRQWCHFDCNWKVAMEAFIESYHVEGTHPQLLKFADYYTWSQAESLHSFHGFDEREAAHEITGNNTITRTGRGDDARQSIAALQVELIETVNASTTQTFVDASTRLVDELPEGTPVDEVMAHFMASAKADDAVRGVIWPEIDPDHQAKCGIAWHLFPNMTIGIGITFALIYRVRPFRTDPDKCIFEAYTLERFPEGQEPETEWIQADPYEPGAWPPVLLQDFDNMREVHRGMRSKGFRGCLPNPVQEKPVSNFHRSLADYMGTGAPRPL
ncbi:MAG: aromatic ring-hydroxylating dioxygenase subunit alpha [Novosphingobium sp.]|nr:aromatic ring-hydroxylating dioxygenase subunit alpha [Novosphingobium sp.]